MTREELEALTVGGESEQVEFKRTTGSLSDGLKAASGMLNSGGGFVLFGVRNDGTPVGQEIGEGTLEGMAEGLRRIEPHVLIQPEVVEVDDGRSVIALSVPGGAAAHRPRSIRAPRRSPVILWKHSARHWPTRSATGTIRVEADR